jgi:hypothetical protein
MPNAPQYRTTVSATVPPFLRTPPFLQHNRKESYNRCYCNTVPTTTPFLPQHRSYCNTVPTTTLFLQQHRPYHNTIPTTTPFLPQHRSYYNTVPTATPFLPQHRSYRNTVPTATPFLRQHRCYGNTVPTATPFLRQHRSYGNTVPTATPFLRQHRSYGTMAVCLPHHRVSPTTGSTIPARVAHPHTTVATAPRHHSFYHTVSPASLPPCQPNMLALSKLPFAAPLITRTRLLQPPHAFLPPIAVLTWYPWDV